MTSRVPVGVLFGVILLMTGRAAPAPPAAASVPIETEAQARTRVRLLQQAALRAARLTGAAWRGMRVRLGFSALMPRVSGTLGWGLQAADAVKPWGGSDPVPVSTSDHQSYAVSAHWDLSRLLFAHEEVTLEMQQQRSAQQGMALCAEVARLYYQRRRLLAGPLDEARRQKVAELTATLDALTGLRGLAEVSGRPSGASAPDAADAEEPPEMIRGLPPALQEE